MSVFGKIKNVLFTEEEETEEIPVIQNEKPIREEIVEERVPEIPRFKNISYEDTVEIPKKNERVYEEKREYVAPKVEVEEEKSPFQSFDEEEFDRLAAINKNRLLERDRRLREEKERTSRYAVEESIKKEEPKKDEKRFKPSPVISPVYGILDKNYTKDDILPRASSDGTLPKVMDVDQVRQKAFGTLETLEKNINNDKMDNIKITSFEDQVDEEANIILDKIEKIEMDDEEAETKPLPKIPKIENEVVEEEKVESNDTQEEIKEIIEEEKKEDEKIENDLFNLIDSMYQNEEGE